MRKLSLVALALLSTSAVASAQTVVRGIVTDTSGDALPGAVVSVTRVSDRTARQSRTDAQGRYSLSGLADGSYGIVFSESGFATLSDVIVLNGGAYVLDAHLAMGAGRSEVPPPFGSIWNGWTGSFEKGWSTLPCERISMSARGGLVFAAGADYEMTFYRGGRAEIAIAEVFGRPPVRSVGSISRDDFGKLCYLATLLRFDRLPDRTGSGADDAGETTVEIVSDGRTKSVREYGGGGPIQMWALARAIDDIKQRSRWTER